MRTSLVAGTVMMASASGVPLSKIRAVSGLTPADLADLNGWLPEAILPALWRLIDAELPEQRPVALRLAAMASFEIFGPLTHMMRCSATVGDALRAFARYSFVMGDSIQTRVEEGPIESALRFHHPMDAEDGGLAAEMGLAVGHRLGLEMGTNQHAIRVEFSHAPNGPVAAYEAFFKVPVRFECAENALILPTRVLGDALPAADRSMVQFIERHFEAVRAQLVAEAPDAEMVRIKEAINRNAQQGEYGADALARRLGMSLRSVQRITRARNTTVRSLLESVRLAHARRLLRDPRLGVEEVAFLLGYSEARAFRRAFRRWVGVSPATFRRAPEPPAQ